MVTIVGLGFVGLTTSLGFAEKGISVFGYEIDPNLKNKIKNGILPFYEPKLDEALVRHNGGNFEVTENLAEAVSKSRYVFFCVGTPCGENGEADLTYLYSALESALAGHNDGRYRCFVIKSTVPPGTVKDKVIPFIQEKGQLKDMAVANNPEFLREGYCYDDFCYPDRIVCGCDDERGRKMLEELYAPFDAPVYMVSPNTGEFIKYASNTLLANLISFSNELSIIADATGGIEVKRAFEVLHQDRRWNGAAMASYFYPGCGYGGYCLPKDTQALYAASVRNGYSPEILNNIIKTNEKMIDIAVLRIMRKVKPNDKVGILGLSFKPGSEDVRESQAYSIINRLKDNGVTNIIAYDPIAVEKFRETHKLELSYAESLPEIVNAADILVIVTAWEEFASVGTTGKTVVDLRYMLDTANF